MKSFVAFILSHILLRSFLTYTHSFLSFLLLVLETDPFIFLFSLIIIIFQKFRSENVENQEDQYRKSFSQKRKVEEENGLLITLLLFYTFQRNFIKIYKFHHLVLVLFFSWKLKRKIVKGKRKEKVGFSSPWYLFS